MSYKAQKDVTAAGDILLYLKNGVGGDGSRKHRMVLERTVTKDTHGQAGRVDTHPQPGKTCPGSGKMERQGWWVFPGTVLFDTVRCLREPSPKTPTAKPAALTAAPCRKKFVRAADSCGFRIGGCFR